MRLHPKENKYATLLVITVLLCVGLALNLKHLNQFPKHIHAWAQTDRYALSLGFIENDFDLFHPQTLVLNHQFPNAWQTADEQSITSVDFPFHEYVVGGIMKLVNDNSPVWFRSYIFLYSLVGLYFLFQLTLLLINSKSRAFLIVFFAATSPVFVYYQAGFLPSIPSFANVCIALYFYFRFQHDKQNLHYFLSLGFLTFAALSRTTFVIPLIALFCAEVISGYASKAISTKKLLSFLLPFAAIGGYFCYNLQLRNIYGSIFLSSPLPPRNTSELWEALHTAVTRWGNEYLSPLHYGLFALLVIIALTYSKARLKALLQDRFTVFTGFYTLGTLAFAGLMLLQFPDHDYYFLDTFFLPILCWLALALRNIPQAGSDVAKAAQLAVVLLFITPLYLYANKVQHQRHFTPYWSKLANTIDNFREAKTLLTQTQIPDTASILVFDPQTPNACFILMEQKGYAMMLRNPKNIATALSWPYDYALLQKQYFVQDIYADYPAIGRQLQHLASGNDLSLVKKVTTPAEGQSALTLLGLEKTSARWSAQKDSLNILAEREYGPSINIPTSKLLHKTNSYLLVEARVNTPPNQTVFLVCAARKGDKQVFFHSQEIGSMLKENTGSHQLQTVFKIPALNDPMLELSFMLWNPQGVEMSLKDVGLWLL